ncbi:hypothetical protein [Streptomyces sp. NRRL B-3229]|uniref:exo-rhamnogalacturonan lyase family protein n=1 Tax=Streptomyces sp. NRRL B-3229 TaxID=1463836 RepID=UPI0004C22A70|nr:hypothetical protein [Streptomyces sp. NRRL B-3229]
MSLLGDEEPEFRTAWLDYAQYCNDTDAQKRQLTGSTWKSTLPAAHWRIAAYAARRENDPALATRAWNELLTGNDTCFPSKRLEPGGIRTPAVLRATREIPWISTNSSARWALEAIQNLALAGDRIPS